MMMMGEGARVPPWSQHVHLSGVDVGGGDEEAADAAALPAEPRKEYPPYLTLPDLKSGLFSTDEFRMYSFKVKPCSRAYSHDWTECPFVHPGENARRRDPRRYSYSCVPCPEFRKGGACRKGDNCEYAHGVFECWLHPTQYRTRPCKDEVGCARRICFFAHTPDQLRVLPTTQQQQQSSPRGAACSPLAESYDGSPLRRQAFESYLTKRLLLARQRPTPHPQVPNRIEAEEQGGTHGVRRYDTDALRHPLSKNEIMKVLSFSDTCEYNIGNIKFSVFSSQEGGINNKVGSTTIHVPELCSVHHPAVQMLLFAEVTSDPSYCQHPMVPRGITDLIEKLSSDKCINAVQTVYKAGWADARGHSTESHNGDALAPVTYALATTQARTAGDGNRTPVLWLDSGAGHHCVGDASVLCNLRAPPAGTAVRMADGFQLPVIMVGDIETENFQIQDVYFVPGLQMNVISVHQLAKCKIFPTFYEKHADLCRDGEQVGGAIVDDNASIYRLYYLAAVGNAAASTS